MTLTKIIRTLHQLADTQANLPVPLTADEREALRSVGYYLESVSTLRRAKEQGRPAMKCDCAASGNALKPKQHGADPHAKNCAVYTSPDPVRALQELEALKQIWQLIKKDDLASFWRHSDDADEQIAVLESCLMEVASALAAPPVAAPPAETEKG